VTYIVQKIDALKSLHPNVEIYGYDDNPIWNSNIPQPTDAEITAEITRLQTEFDNNLFQRQRADAYPSMQEQADMQYWDSVNGTTTWQDAIALVKSTYPKGGS
jgi:hypothetical protein